MLVCAVCRNDIHRTAPTWRAQEDTRGWLERSSRHSDECCSLRCLLIAVTDMAMAESQRRGEREAKAK